MAEAQSPDDGTVTIKKYANRRLYNTSTSTYVTLEDLAEMVREQTDFVVFDAKSGEDITRSVLTQIIFEQESKGKNLLPAKFLRQLIRFYDDSMQALVPQYLEMSLDSLAREQEKFRGQITQAFGGNPFNAMEKQVQQNMAIFEQAVSTFSPFSADSARPGSDAPSGKSAAPDREAEPNDDIDDLRDQLTSLQKQLEKLAKSSK